MNCAVYQIVCVHVCVCVRVRVRVRVRAYVCVYVRVCMRANVICVPPVWHPLVYTRFGLVTHVSVMYVSPIYHYCVTILACNPCVTMCHPCCHHVSPCVIHVSSMLSPYVIHVSL